MLKRQLLNALRRTPCNMDTAVYIQFSTDIDNEGDGCINQIEYIKQLNWDASQDTDFIRIK